MKVICAWCKKFLSDDGEPAVDGMDVSHGVCEECKKKVLKELDLEDKKEETIPI